MQQLGLNHLPQLVKIVWIDKRCLSWQGHTALLLERIKISIGNKIRKSPTVLHAIYRVATDSLGIPVLLVNKTFAVYSHSFCHNHYSSWQELCFHSKCLLGPEHSLIMCMHPKPLEINLINYEKKSTKLVSFGFNY